MRELKVATSMWMKNSGYFPGYVGWAEGYGAFTCAYMEIGRLSEYIKNQKEHHTKRTFEEEYRNLLIESGVNIDEKYFP